MGLTAGVYCYCKRPAKNKHARDSNLDQELSNLLKSAHDTSIQIDGIVNSARNSRIVQGCAAGLTSTSQASAGGSRAGLNSCSDLGAAGDSCSGKGDTAVVLASGHSTDEIQGAKKHKKNIFKS